MTDRCTNAVSTIPGRSVVEHMAVESGKGVAKSVAKTAVTSTLHSPPDVTAAPTSASKDAPPVPAPSSPAGRSGPAGTSEVVKEPNQSFAPLYAPLVIAG